MKLNLKVFKKGKPIYWIGGAVILFVLFYFLFNRGASGSTTVVSSGPSEALQAAQLSAGVQTAQIQAQANSAAQQTAGAITIAGIQAQLALAQTDAQAHSTDLQTNQSAAVAFAQIDANKAEQLANMSYSFESAKLASETALQTKASDNALLAHQLDTNAAVVVHQLDTNAAMFNDQLQAQIDLAGISSHTQIAGMAINAVSGSNVKEITRLPVLQQALAAA